MLSRGMVEVLASGGPTLQAILLASFVTWTLLLERLLALGWGLPAEPPDLEARWRGRAERTSWRATAIRRAWLARSRRSAAGGLAAARALIATMPLLGLLGTVLGMLQVFEGIGLQGHTTPRLMAAGISQATVSTLGGLAAALLATPALHLVEGLRDRRIRGLEDRLTSP